MRKSSRRLIVIGAAGVLLALAAGLTLYGLKDSVAYFYAPSDVVVQAKAGERVRIGGLVETGSVARGGGVISFKVTDGVGAVAVSYQGDPPDLFAEGQGVVAEGVWRGGDTFAAERILAKHDEKYMPREVVEALKAKGEWKGTP
ncbi:MAG: cytochrome c maturation protein CcmE [Hyphomonadaceae bacterium]|nr:MAG: cytochrome c-type bioproteinis protein CcmE [Caulobacteraceae bacterium]MBT9446550.1 cytochrome c maturation protein CcmE [Hyphomonadaceae bacterium]TPW05374.1 MAG: cytochrome c-type bioproteinis protein CcmE [Alphaproteobacteria bacterium]